MKTSELRIGNIICDGIFIYLINCIEINIIQAEILEIHKYSKAKTEDFYKQGQCYSLNIENIEPIPLTEEWLLKFGFKKEGDLNWWSVPKESNYKAHHLMKMKNAWTWFIDFDDTGDNTHLVAGFNYVHQLQNLYFALTENELEIK